MKVEYDYPKDTINTYPRIGVGQVSGSLYIQFNPDGYWHSFRDGKNTQAKGSEIKPLPTGTVIKITIE